MHPGREAIDDSVRILKQGETFVLFDRHGDALPGGRSSAGLYHDGCRHLSMLTLHVCGGRPLLLKSTVTHDNLVLAVDFTNPDVCREDAPPADTVHVFRGKLLREGAMHEIVRLTNHGLDPVRLSVTFRFRADFADIFEVRGNVRAQHGELLDPEVGVERVVLGYRGLDGVVRRTTVRAHPRPTSIDHDTIRFEVALAPRQDVALELDVSCEGERPAPAIAPARWEPAYRAIAAERAEIRSKSATLVSDNPLFNRWLDRSQADFYMMVTQTEHGPYPYAGIPWYNTIFGRDGIWTALFTAWMDPDVARGVLTTLAATQADRHDDARDAEPGKIVHEMRRGEMAALGEIPFLRYYGTVDATPLFVALAGAYWRRTADVDTIRTLWPNIERALSWMDTDGDRDRDGFLEYRRRSSDGLAQQGWKDSVDSIFHADGRLATGAIALCEVQGYAYAARRNAAELARVLGKPERAAELDAQAELIRARFDQAFWCPPIGTFAIALDGEKRPCQVRTSNPGHCLWSGIVDPSRAAQVGEALTADEMFSGWGVRTVSRLEVRYNPMSYHDGSVWPHDSAICAAGLARYGMRDEALKIFTALFDASVFMDLNRLPELMCGFSRKVEQGPTLYPVACSPQAWSSAAVFALIEATLGLDVDAPNSRVRFWSPRLPPWLSWLEVRGLRVPGGRLDVRVNRVGDRCTVDVLDREGSVDLIVDER